MTEIWKDIEGYEGLYQVSNIGNVKRVEHEDYRCRQGYRVFKERYLTPNKDQNGYLNVGLWKNNTRKKHKIHRLVASAFILNPDSLPQINHKDENKQNNSADNLEWCTSKYNNNYGSHKEVYQRLKKSRGAK